MQLLRTTHVDGEVGKQVEGKAIRNAQANGRIVDETSGKVPANLRNVSIKLDNNRKGGITSAVRRCFVHFYCCSCVCRFAIVAIDYLCSVIVFRISFISNFLSRTLLCRMNSARLISIIACIPL